MTARETTYLLGIDTGGTFTDAVLVDAARLGEGPAAVRAGAKRLTTPEDLARGIGAAMAAVLEAGGVTPGQIGLVSLSTTLATNALVEGRGARAGLVMIGFSDADISRQGLGAALGGDPLIRIGGGHDALGAEIAPPDLAALEAGLEDALERGVEAMAVCGYFAVRNPAHEEAARALIADRTGLPVTCSGDLSSRVGGPRRALTALFNARLTPLIGRLIVAAEGLMRTAGIAAPLMVVRGDGALVSAGFARGRPVETILSGPAASLVGAGWLTGLRDAVVSDIGGTTTDIAVLRDGRPRLDPDGAEVGGHRTMVEAVAMRTHGLGGDSEVGADPAGGLALGPRRLVPVSLLAADHPALVHGTLDRQLAADRPGPLDGRFLLCLGAGRAETGPEGAVLAALEAGPQPADRVLASRPLASAASRLIAHGRIIAAGFTPSDAAHVLGLHGSWDREAARKAAHLLARRRRPDGMPMAGDGEALARTVVARLTRRSAELVLEAALGEDGYPQAGLAASALAQAALDGRRGLVAPAVPLTVPLIGLGASAPTYYPAVARMLGAPSAVPDHAGVANAVGAVVGAVRLSRAAAVTAPAEGRFRAHLPHGPRDFADLDAAETALAGALAADLASEALRAGAGTAEIDRRIDRREVSVEGRSLFVESLVTVTATGRPRLADDPGAEPEIAMAGIGPLRSGRPG